MLKNYGRNDEDWLPQSAQGRDAEESFVVFGESNFTASKPSSQKYNKCYKESYVTIFTKNTTLKKVKTNKNTKRTVTPFSNLLQGIVKKTFESKH